VLREVNTDKGKLGLAQRGEKEKKQERWLTFVDPIEY
jgi:hypothetical protein